MKENEMRVGQIPKVNFKRFVNCGKIQSHLKGCEEKEKEKNKI